VESEGGKFFSKVVISELICKKKKIGHKAVIDALYGSTAVRQMIADVSWR